MTRRYHKARKLGVGSIKGSMVRTMAAFDPETDGQVRDYARKNGVSFAEAVRQLVEFGLMDADTMAKEATE